MPHGASTAVAVALTILFLIPVPPGAPELPPELELAVPLDKVIHFLLFALAAPPWRRSFADLGARRPALATLLFTVVYAGGIELAQGAWTATRSAEWGDLLAGFAGALLAVALTGGPRRRRVRSGSARPTGG